MKLLCRLGFHNTGRKTLTPPFGSGHMRCRCQPSPYSADFERRHRQAQEAKKHCIHCGKKVRE